MQSCKGCREQQTNEHLCLSCIEDLSCWLREIPALYSELGSVRLPGSVHSPGPRSFRMAQTAGASPVRLEVVDLLDRGETLARLWTWTDDRGDVEETCLTFRSHLLTVAAEPWAGDFYRSIRALCRDLGRAVGQPEERPVGKCSQATGDELCRGQLLRTEGGTAYCRRCGHKPDITAQPAWVTLREAAMIVGKPIETVRTWYKRGKLVPLPVASAGNWCPWPLRWSDPVGPAPANRAWLPTLVRLANDSVATLPLRPAIVNHGSGAELSPLDRNQAATTAATRQMNSDNGARSGSDADVLGRLVTGNVTPSAGAPAGKAVAPDPPS
jgi:hypothetical protein